MLWDFHCEKKRCTGLQKVIRKTDYNPKLWKHDPFIWNSRYILKTVQDAAIVTVEYQ